jgi:urease accessory protein
MTSQVARGELVPMPGTSKKITRIGIGGPVGSGKTAIVEAITPRLLDLGIKVLIITNDVVTTEDAKHVRRTLKGVLLEECIVGVETGACPHTAVREDPSMNLAAVEDMEHRFPESDLVLIESGGDNLTLTFSPALVDYFLYVIDVAAGDKIPRKDGPGITRSDVLIINKTDLAPYVDASLEVMERDSLLMRGQKPFVFTNCKTGEGIPELVTLIETELLFDRQVQSQGLA